MHGIGAWPHGRMLRFSQRAACKFERQGAAAHGWHNRMPPSLLLLCVRVRVRVGVRIRARARARARVRIRIRARVRVRVVTHLRRDLSR